jgi:hypothetical protein
VDVSGGVAGDPIDHVNLLKVFFSSEIASVTVPCQLRQPGLFSFWACCFCSILDEVARAQSGSLRPNRLPILSAEAFANYN